MTHAFPLPKIPALWNLLILGVSNSIGRLRGIFFSTPLETGPREADQALIRDALSGGPGFERLVRTYETMVYRTAFRFVGQEADACDVAQEVFLKVHKSLPQFRGASSLSTWIYAITANLSRNALRSRKNREKRLALLPEDRPDGRPFWDTVADEKASVTRSVESKELGLSLQKALMELPEDYREAVILRDLEDLDYREIAGILGTGLGTVKSRIARGRAMLREKLERLI